jgi:hypothetical protein
LYAIGGDDRRSRPERRRRDAAGYFRGWLAFESAVGKRRLLGIPDDWPDAGEARLEELCKQADVVHSRLDALLPSTDKK